MTYVYGHLITTSFTAALVVAFTISGLLDRRARVDLAFAVMFGCASLVGIAELALAAAPSALVGRLFLVAAGLVYVSSTAAAYAAFAPLVSTPTHQVRYQWFLVVYVSCAAMLETLVLTGYFDRGELRMLHVSGITSAVPALSPGGAVALWLFASANVVTAPLMFAPGPMALERHASGAVLLLNPLVAGHDLAIFAGALDSVPIGGYFATLSGLLAIVGIAVIRLRIGGAVVIGDYVVERRLGTGGMADVFVARRRVPGLLSGVYPRVAIKRLRDEIARDSDVAALFANEARALAALAHPNIVRLLDAGLHGDEPFLVLELVEGATLAECLRLGPLEPAAAAEVCRQLCEALAYVHAARDGHDRPLHLIHRDVKPHNILIALDGTVKLNDFGIAWFRGRRVTTRTGSVRGTLRYLAPEQAAGARCDARVDLHAVGLVWFECVVGRPFFDAATDPELLVQVATLRRDLVPPAMRSLFARATAIDPAARAGSAAELAARFAGLADTAQGRRALAERVIEARAADPGSEPLPTAETLVAAL